MPHCEAGTWQLTSISPGRAGGKSSALPIVFVENDDNCIEGRTHEYVGGLIAQKSDCSDILTSNGHVGGLVRMERGSLCMLVGPTGMRAACPLAHILSPPPVSDPRARR